MRKLDTGTLLRLVARSEHVRGRDSALPSPRSVVFISVTYFKFKKSNQ